MNPSNCSRWTIALTLTVWAVPLLCAQAAPPSDPDARASLIGEPIALIAQPEKLVLTGPRSFQQFVMIGRYADGSVRDLTVLCDWACETEGVIEVQPGGLVLPLRDGATHLRARAGGQVCRVPVAVEEFTRSEGVSFRREVIAALNVSGCNGGSCHGIPSGRNGFRLSLWGQDPAFDFEQLTHDALGRRTDSHHPDASLLLLKALARVPHEGGRRFAEPSLPAQILRTWMREGLRDDSASLPALERIEIDSGPPLLIAPVRWRQLAVRAHFADGTMRDVTPLCVFASSDKQSTADVSPSGLVEFFRRGEVAITCRYLEQMQTVRLVYQEPVEGFRWPDPPVNNYIDRHVFARLEQLRIPPSELCTDAEFLRRVYLDVCGILPPVDEVRTFAASTDPHKREKLIDSLLARPEFVDFWTQKWGDVLRVNRDRIGPKGVQKYHAWLRQQIAENTPLDQLTRELLMSDGASHQAGPANFYAVARENTKEFPQALAEDLAETSAQLLLGIRLQCAKCHHHPTERWSQDDYYGLAAFFAQVKQVREGNPPNKGQKDARPISVAVDAKLPEVIHSKTGKAAVPRFPGGQLAEVPAGADRRAVLAHWFVRNPQFARAIVNRIWFHLLGRGIVDAVDDFRDSNPSVNDELLDALAKDFAAHGFDGKYLIRLIVTSRTYQLSERANALNKDDGKYFSHAITRLLPAEVLLDAICTATEVPEKYPGFSAGTRAVQLPDGEVFQLTGANVPYNDRHPFMKLFGQPARQLACECERETTTSLSQALEMLNGPTLAEKVRQPNNRLGRLLARKSSDEDILAELYLATLGRLPSEAASRSLLEHVRSSANRREAWEDVLWGLLRSKEFIFRH